MTVCPLANVDVHWLNGMTHGQTSQINFSHCITDGSRRPNCLFGKMRGNCVVHILWTFRSSFSPCPYRIVVVVFHFDSGGRKARSLDHRAGARAARFMMSAVRFCVGRRVGQALLESFVSKALANCTASNDMESYQKDADNYRRPLHLLNQSALYAPKDGAESYEINCEIVNGQWICSTYSIECRVENSETFILRSKCIMIYIAIYDRRSINKH